MTRRRRGSTDDRPPAAVKAGWWQALRPVLVGERDDEIAAVARSELGGGPPVAPSATIPADDPILDALRGEGAVDVADLSVASPALDAFRAAGARLLVPLVSQGDLLGVLALGPRLSGRDYSTDDRTLLTAFAAQAAPALRVAQLVEEREADRRQHELIEQELRIAHLIQRRFLPRSLPDPRGWRLAAHYQAARAVGGDFYDAVELPGDRLALVVGDVTDKGVPAALVMASTRGVLRAAMQESLDPEQVLARANLTLCQEIPPGMFVTCQYAVLDLTGGTVRMANAGHPVPYLRTAGGVAELRARGMPLGLMPDAVYEVVEAALAPGDTLLFHSDGLSEAHSPGRELFGLPRLAKVVGAQPLGGDLIPTLLAELTEFSGPGWDQEDDLTLVEIHRTADG